MSRHADGNRLYLEITKTGKSSWRMAYRRPITRTNNGLSFGVVSVKAGVI